MQNIKSTETEQLCKEFSRSNATNNGKPVIMVSVDPEMKSNVEIKQGENDTQVI